MVQDFVRCGILCFEDVGPNVKKNPLPEHGKSVNMVQGCPGKFKVKYISHIRQSLVEMHHFVCEYSHYEHDHDRRRICSVNQRGCRQVRKDVQEMLDEGVIEILQNRNVDEDEPEVNMISPVFRIPEPIIIKYDGRKQKVSRALTIKPAGPVPYSSEKAIPYRYNVVAVENGKEVSLPSSSVVNVADVSVSTPNLAPVVKPSFTLGTPASVGPSGNVNEDYDEMLRLIKRSEYNVNHTENLETVNLGSEDCMREVKIGALLEESVKKELIELLREYVDVFAWSYEDMTGLDTGYCATFLTLEA
ncbi:hypothetical protein KIW84_061656 [Lathyrus oleraceus]|uniref:Uncharacterized protein n=1 Tax=Pisum sativum TaxID=3888 RepID=A0A9D5A4H7_PEA|nr:hypothetical protein KIW84_061656 [Pisum sativum]